MRSPSLRRLTVYHALCDLSPRAFARLGSLILAVAAAEKRAQLRRATRVRGAALRRMSNRAASALVVLLWLVA